MNMKNKMIPRLRFKGFKGKWKATKLNKVSSIIGGGTPSKKNDKYWNGNINWYSPDEIEGQVFTSNSKHKITKLGYKKSSAKMLPVSTVLFTSRAGIGRTAILRKEATTNQGFQSIVPKRKLLDSYFVYSYSLGNHFKHYICKMANGSTFKEISNTSISEMPILVPSLLEQKAIGSFFAKLDKLISLNQKEINLLRKLKKSYLQKMFPQKGSSVPRLRFKGFNEKWENSKISDLGNIQAGGDTSKLKLNKNGKYPVVANNLTNDGIINYCNNYKVTSPSVTVTGRGFIGVAKARYYNYTPVGRLLFFKTKLDAMFTALAINNIHLIPEYTGVPQLTAPQLGSYSLCYPSLPEQHLIGSFFQHLDNLITKQSDKLKLLKKLKRSYLQKMFV